MTAINRAIITLHWQSIVMVVFGFCLSDCLCVCLRASRPVFTKFFVYVNYGRDSDLIWWCCDISAGPFVISLFLFVKIDLATDSGSEYDRDKKKIGFYFFLHV